MLLKRGREVFTTASKVNSGNSKISAVHLVLCSLRQPSLAQRKLTVCTKAKSRGMAKNHVAQPLAPAVDETNNRSFFARVRHTCCGPHGSEGATKRAANAEPAGGLAEPQ